jgi:hypothetical protein
LREDAAVQLLRPRAPGRPESRFAGFIGVQPGESSVVLRMPHPYTLRFPIAEGESPPPADGTELRLIAQGPANEPPFDTPLGCDEPTLPAGPARMEDGQLAVENCVDRVRCIASAPDGSWTELRAQSDRILEPARFLLPRRVEILARWQDGRPAAGETFAIHDSGSFWNPVVSKAVSDSDGRVVLSGLPLHAVARISRLAPRDRGLQGKSLATVDLRTGDARIAVTLAAEVDPSGESRPAAPRSTRPVHGHPGAPPRRWWEFWK